MELEKLEKELAYIIRRNDARYLRLLFEYAVALEKTMNLPK